MSHTLLRPGMTAIAAALAFSSTPLFAQSAEPVLADSAAPVITAPSAALAPSTAPAEQNPAATLNIPKINVNMDDAPIQVDQAAPVSEPVASAPRTASAPPRETAPADIVPATVAKEVTPVTPPPQITEFPAAKAAPATVAAAPIPSAGESTVVTDETLPIAGGIVGALVLAGGAVAFGRRRRRDREERILPRANAEPLVFASPTPVEPTLSMVRTGNAPLPAEFDLSRYGRHTQAAYRGPTAENPSLSLKKRLKRARFYDQRARIVMPAPPAAAVAPAEPATKPVRTGDYVTSRRFSGGAPAFRPAYQG